MINKTEEEIMSTWKTRDGDPLVTIRSITYNHVNYISDALDGFLNQVTNFKFEVIVHDDASTDGTSDVIRKYAEKYPHIITPIIQKENQYSKKNGGIRRAINSNLRGKYIALCEGDDYWTYQNKLAKQIAYMESHPDCSLSFHAVNYEQNGKIIKNDRISNKEKDIPSRNVILGGGKYIATPSICCRTVDFLDYPKFRLMADVGDFPLQIMLADRGKVHYFPDLWGVYRVSSSGSWSESQKNREAQIRHLNNQIDWISEFDDYSKKRFFSETRKEIAVCNLRLYKLGYISFKELMSIVNALEPSKEKYIYYISAIKNIPKNHRNSMCN